jgi:hypothetical protein
MTWNNIPTFNPGDVVQASDLNTYFKGNLEHLHGYRNVASTGSISTFSGLTNTAWAQLSTLSVTLTTEGGPVFLLFGCQFAVSDSPYFEARWYNSTAASVVTNMIEFKKSSAGEMSLAAFDLRAAGTYTWIVQTRMSGGSPSPSYQVERPVLFAWET